MEAQTELSFGWIASVRLSETAWFAPDVGLVRRSEQFSGRALWLFRFQGNSRYEAALQIPLVSSRAFKAQPGGDGEETQVASKIEQEEDPDQIILTGDRLWSHSAVCLERSGRRLRVSGLAVQWAVQAPALATAH
jgi:hypothetical protein